MITKTLGDYIEDNNLSKKIPVFDAEGMPSLTPEIENQIRQLGTDITYPTDEIQNFLENFSI